LVLLFSTQDIYAQQPSVVLSGARDEYKNLDETKPVLVNESSQSIYLPSEDCGQARLWLHYMNNEWRQSIGKDCYGNDTDIEVKPGERYQIPALVWRPLRTREGKLVERKDFPGRYKVVMRYSLKPTIVKPSNPRLSKPRLKFKEDRQQVSAEFLIVQ
jgi:hypothetical protein